MPFRFYVDASLLGVAPALTQLREDVTYPGAPGCPIAHPRTPDTEWMPVAGREGWLVLMRDKKIRTRPGELRAFRDHGLRAVVLTKSGNAKQFECLRLLMRFWDDIEAATEADAPRMWALTSRGLREITLPAH